MFKILDQLHQNSSLKIFIISFSIWAMLGVFTMLLNFSKVLAMLDGSYFIFGLSIIGNFSMGFVIQSFYVLALSLLLYFVSAATGLILEIGAFIRVSIRVLMFTFLIGISDLIGFLMIGEKFTMLGTIGILTYIPFYVMVFISLRHLLPTIGEYSKYLRQFIALIGTILIIIISYPFTG